jgi:hypothetical protein
MLAVYSLVTWRLLWLTYQTGITPDAPCTVALQSDEWQALYLFTQKKKRLPNKPPSLRQATRWIGQLGGFLGRKGDGEPGVKVLWRGWSRLQDIVSTYTLLRPSQDVGNAYTLNLSDYIIPNLLISFITEKGIRTLPPHLHLTRGKR